MIKFSTLLLRNINKFNKLSQFTFLAKPTFSTQAPVPFNKS